MQSLIFWASYAWFPFIFVCLGFVWHSTASRARAFALIAILASLPLAWARFIEPQILLTQTTQIDLSKSSQAHKTVRVALFADTQYGVFPNAIRMDRIVNRILSKNVDAVFMAGDWLLESPIEDIPGHIAPIAAITDANIPIFGVLGNHDIYRNYPPFAHGLYAALRRNGVTIVDNRAYETQIGGVDLVIAGASDLWKTRQDFSFSTTIRADLPVLLLTHNPDTAYSVPSSFSYDLMLAGHTHGGQINLLIPALTERIIPTRYPFNEGLHEFANIPPVFVTAGTGQTGIPMRFLRPPRIDILEIKLPVSGGAVR